MVYEHVAIPKDMLADLLRDVRGLVFLRNAEYIENLDRGGDIDLLVAELDRACREATSRLGPPLMVMERSYVCSFFWHWGQIDFLPRVEWHGAEFVCREELFRRAVRIGNGVWRVHPVHEALICWFTSLLWGGFFKDRYRELIIRVAREYPDEFLSVLTRAVGRRWGGKLIAIAQDGVPEISVQWASALRRALWWRAWLRAPLQTLQRWCRFWCTEVMLRLSPPVPWVAVLGLDGSGKTSVIQNLRNSLGTASFPKGVRVIHWRPGFFRSKGQNLGPVSDPHGKPPRSRIASLAKILFLLVDWWLGYWGRLIHLRARGQLLLFDRHFVDILVDPKRYRYGGPVWLAWLACRLVPKPDIFIFLDLPAEVAYARKSEVAVDDARKLRERYLELARSLPNAHVVDAARPLEEVVAKVQEIILNHMRARTRRRLGRLEGVVK